MPTNPTVDEVRELRRRYSGEPPEPPPCSVCAKPMFVDEVSSDGFKFGCRCGHQVRSSEPYLFDEEVVKLCNHFLASPMTAGEFAAELIAVCECQCLDWEALVNNAPPHEAVLRATRNARLFEWSAMKLTIESLARDRNIIIVEPTK